jgi:hypothetical protein
VLIDFERCTAGAARPQNVTQFLQFLATPTVRQVLRRKGVGVDVAALRAWGGAYRRGEVAGAEGSKSGEFDFMGALGLRDAVVNADDAADDGAVPEGRAARRLRVKLAREAAAAADML